MKKSWIKSSTSQLDLIVVPLALRNFAESQLLTATPIAFWVQTLTESIIHNFYLFETFFFNLLNHSVICLLSHTRLNTENNSSLKYHENYRNIFPQITNEGTANY